MKIKGLEIDYHEYLLSDDWQDKKITMVWLRKSCYNCGSKEKLQIHHLTYKRLGWEKIRDLRVLCSKCHKKEHGKNGRTP